MPLLGYTLVSEYSKVDVDCDVRVVLALVLLTGRSCWAACQLQPTTMARLKAEARLAAVPDTVVRALVAGRVWQ